jgi:site-specific recombinase XerD
VHSVTLFAARRADIEGFGRHLESLGPARATVARRLCTIACFYRYAEEEGLIAFDEERHRGVQATDCSRAGGSEVVVSLGQQTQHGGVV